MRKILWWSVACARMILRFMGYCPILACLTRPMSRIILYFIVFSCFSLPGLWEAGFGMALRRFVSVVDKDG